MTIKHIESLNNPRKEKEGYFVIVITGAHLITDIFDTDKVKFDGEKNRFWYFNTCISRLLEEYSAQKYEVNIQIQFRKTHIDFNDYSHELRSCDQLSTKIRNELNTIIRESTKNKLVTVEWLNLA